MIKTVTTFLLTLFLFNLCAPAHAELFEINARGTYIYPHQGGNWDSASGGEVQFIYWHLEELGWAFSAGYQAWKPRSSETLTPIDTPRGPATQFSTLSGDASMLPLSVSFIYRGELAPNVQGYAEAGIRYVLVDSEVNNQLTIEQRKRNGELVFRETNDAEFDFDEGLLAAFGGSLHFPIGRRLEVFTGGGVQIDFVRADQRLNGIEQPGKNAQQSFYIFAGFSW